MGYNPNIFHLQVGEIIHLLAINPNFRPGTSKYTHLHGCLFYLQVDVGDEIDMKTHPYLLDKIRFYRLKPQLGGWFKLISEFWAISHINCMPNNNFTFVIHPLLPNYTSQKIIPDFLEGFLIPLSFKYDLVTYTRQYFCLRYIVSWPEMPRFRDLIFQGVFHHLGCTPKKQPSKRMQSRFVTRDYDTFLGF